MRISLSSCVIPGLLIAATAPAQLPLYSFGGLSSGAEAGSSVAITGDVDADGVADLVVGAPFGDGAVPNTGHAHVFSGADGSELYLFTGTSGQDEFGASVAGAGDVNGDGFSDVIIGAPKTDSSGLDAGRAVVFSGADGSVLYTFDGAAAGDHFGASVSGAGEVNGDGYPDFIIGVPGDDTVGNGAGSALVISGKDGTTILLLLGDSPLDAFGASVSDAGDVNADGLADVVVGSPSAAFNGPVSGRVRVISGADGTDIYVRDGASGDRLGFSVGGAGDVDGDGLPDVVLGAPLADANGQDSGQVLVVSGADGSVLFTFDGAAPGDHFGVSVAAAGDADGDGNADVAVGAADADIGGRPDSGRAQVFSGADGSVLRTIRGNSSLEQLGRSVAGNGDIDGDGFDDLFVGAPKGGSNGQISGSAQVFAIAPFDQFGENGFDGDFDLDEFGHTVAGAGDVNNDGVPDVILGAIGGPLGGYARIFSGADNSVIRTLTGLAAGEEFSHGLDGLGDLDGDGFGEVVVGSGHDSIFATLAGRATVFSGVDGSVMFQWLGSISFGHFGASVSTAGDVNNDGTPDIIVGELGGNADRSGNAKVYSGVDGALLYTFSGVGPDDFLGFAVSEAGDVNGDGFDDVIVGASESRQAGLVGAGYARVYSGKDGSTLFTFFGDGVDDKFGAAVGGGGDVNADGIPDLIVGAPTDDNNGMDSGMARVFSGADGSVLYSIDGFGGGFEFGDSTQFAGDVDGDGFDDFIVGAPFADVGAVLAAGQAYVFSGVDGSVLATFDGANTLSEFGHSVAAAGDINGDNHADVVVGSPGEDNAGVESGSGHVYVSQVQTDPGIFLFYGAPCRGSDGKLPRVGSNGRPVLGLSFDISLSYAVPGAVAAAGFDTDPKSLVFGGTGGCSLLALPLLSIGAVTDPMGKASTGSVTVPNVPTLVGQSLYVQWIVTDPGANFVGIAMSDGVGVIIGQ